jgi:hypothetical protein
MQESLTAFVLCLLAIPVSVLLIVSFAKLFERRPGSTATIRYMLALMVHGVLAVAFFRLTGLFAEVGPANIQPDSGAGGGALAAAATGSDGIALTGSCWRRRIRTGPSKGLPSRRPSAPR